MTVHASITEARIVRMVKRAMRTDGGAGICTACGRTAKGYVEPDAERYPCAYRSCAQSAVYGAEQLLLMGIGAR